jgi:hypothetical protein
MTDEPTGMFMDFSDIPQGVVRHAMERTGDYLVGFVTLGSDARGPDGRLGGSGTLVRMGDTYGVLTAQHVIDHLPKAGEIGIILPRSEDAPAHAARPTIDAQSTQRIGFPRGSIESDGPDLGFLKLSPSDVEWIGAIKSFYNLELVRDEILGDQQELHLHAWALSGFPNERAKEDDPQKGYYRVMRFPGLLYLSWIERLPDADPFDYVDLKVGYAGSQNDPPQSFQGFSGGGLWHVELKGTTRQDVGVSRCRLFGVAFYETEIVASRKCIRCHWRRSVYEQLYDKVVRTRSATQDS